MKDWLRPFISRVIAAAISAVIGVVSVKLGLNLDTGQADAFAEWAGGFLTLVSYSLSHRLLDKKINPGDAADPGLAGVEKEQAAVLAEGYPGVEGEGEG